MTSKTIDGPFFEDLEIGQVFTEAPAATLTSGMAETHRSILGERLRLSLDAPLSNSVTGRERPLASPSLVWNLAIGQSTLVTHNVVANLFYRDLHFKRFPSLGETLRSTTEVLALRTNRPKPDRPPTGLALLRIVTDDGNGVPVLDFKRCAMLPIRKPDSADRHEDDIHSYSSEPGVAMDLSSVGDWNLEPLMGSSRNNRHVSVGDRISIRGGDCVTSAPELARLTLNIAKVHHDVSATDGRRLVYGGHTIGLALAQTTRALPNLVTVLGWHSCDHLAPVYEGDTLWSSLVVEGVEPFESASVVHLRSLVTASSEDGRQRNVLRWRFVAVNA